MLSIKGKLYLEWFLSLIGIVIVSVIGLYLHFVLIWLPSIEYVQLFVALIIAILTAISAFWYRVISEIDTRYEHSSKKWIEQLKDKLGEIRRQIQNTPPQFYIGTIERQRDEVNRALSSLTNHGKRFTVKLYRVETIDKAKNLIVKVDEFSKIAEEVISEWVKHYETTFSSHQEDYQPVNQYEIYDLLFGQTSNGRYELNKQYRVRSDLAQSIRDKKPEQTKDVEQLREEILKELSVIEKELEDFLLAN